MNERIIHTRPDGSVAVTIPADNAIVSDGQGGTRKLTADEIMAKDVPNDSTNVRMATIAEVPSDRLFRDAWDDSNPEPVIGVNVAKAKEIAHNVRRMRRQEQLAPLDAEEGFVTTTEQRKATIALEKQAILDANAGVQTAIDAAIDEVATPVVADASAIKSVLSAAGML